MRHVLELRQSMQPRVAKTASPEARRAPEAGLPGLKAAPGSYVRQR